MKKQTRPNEIFAPRAKYSHAALLLAALLMFMCACAAPAAPAPTPHPAAPAAAAPLAPAEEAAIAQEAGFGMVQGAQYDRVESAAAPADAAAPAAPVAGGAQNQTQPHMIIRNASISVETDEFDANMRHIEDKVTAIGGYIESSHLVGQPPEANQSRGREVNITVRVPQEQFEAFIRDVEGSGNVTALYRGSEDVTMQYYDNESRLETLKIQLSRLEAILTKSEKLADVLALETEIARIRYEIESLTTTQRRYAQLVQYATVSVQLYEVKDVQYAPPADDIGSKISNLFISVVNGLSGFGEWVVIILAGISPLLALAAVALVVVIAVRKRRKLKKQKPSPPSDE